MNFLTKLRKNLRGISSSEIIGLAVSFFLFAVIGPIAIGRMVNITAVANQTVNWDSAVLTVFQVVLPIIWAIGVAIKYMPGRE